MTKWVYSETVRDHFLNPRNVLRDEDPESFDAVGRTGNVKCGDEMVVYLKVDPERLVITDCKWQTYGCASAIASTSMLSEMVRGMSLEDAARITPKDIFSALGGLPDNKVHCSVLGDKALRAAIEDYYRRHGLEDRLQALGPRVVCHCLNVTEADIEEAVLEGARSFEELQERTKVGTGCGECQDEARQVLATLVEKHFGLSGRA